MSTWSSLNRDNTIIRYTKEVVVIYLYVNVVLLLFSSTLKGLGPQQIPTCYSNVIARRHLHCNAINSFAATTPTVFRRRSKIICFWARRNYLGVAETSILPNLPLSSTMSHSAKKSESSIRPARIVPAIPLPYSRVPKHKKTEESKEPQRALTPNRSEKSTDFSRHNGVQRDGSESQSTSSIQEPMTPDSFSSTVVKGVANGDMPGVDVDTKELKGAWNTCGEIYPTFT
jgi:hypothetical protein